jgi:hypothetical protein
LLHVRELCLDGLARDAPDEHCVEYGNIAKIERREPVQNPDNIVKARMAVFTA